MYVTRLANYFNIFHIGKERLIKMKFEKLQKISIQILVLLLRKSNKLHAPLIIWIGYIEFCIALIAPYAPTNPNSPYLLKSTNAPSLSFKSCLARALRIIIKGYSNTKFNRFVNDSLLQTSIIKTERVYNFTKI